MYIKYSVFLNNINENFSDYDKDDILTDDFIKNFIDFDDIESSLDYYIEENDLDINDKYNIQNTDGFFDKIKTELTYYFDDFMDNIYDNLKNGKLKIYRKIKVDNEWLENFLIVNKNIGIYWSYDENAAEAHWGVDGNNEVTFEALIDENEIDWKTTIELNINPNFSEEKEIRVFDNIKLNIISIKYNDEYIDMSKFKNKTYLA